MDDDEDYVAFGTPLLISLFDAGGDLPPFQHGLGAPPGDGGPALLTRDDAVEPCVLLGKPGGTVRTSDVVSLWSRGLTLSAPPGGGPLLWTAEGGSPSTFVLKGVGDDGNKLAVNAIFTLRHDAVGSFVLCTQRSLASGELGLACLPMDTDSNLNEAWFTVDGIVDSGFVDKLPLLLGASEVAVESDAGHNAALQPSVQSGALPIDAAALLGASAAPEESSLLKAPCKSADVAPAASGIRRMSPGWLRRSRSGSPPAVSKMPASAAQAEAAAVSLPPSDVIMAPAAALPTPHPLAAAAAGGGVGNESASDSDSEFSCEIGEGALGVTLRLSSAGQVVFNGVQAGGQGARVGISDGDLLLELQGESLRQRHFDEASWANLIKQVRSSERPLRLRVGHRSGGVGSIEAFNGGDSEGKRTKMLMSHAPESPSSRALLTSPRPAIAIAAGPLRSPPLRQGHVRVYRPAALWNAFSSRRLLLFPDELVLRPATSPPPQQSPGSGKGNGLGSCMSDPARPKVGLADATGAAGSSGVGGLLASVDEEDTVLPLATMKVSLLRPPGSLSQRRDPAFQYSFDLLSPFGCLTLCFWSGAAKAEWVAALSQAIMTALEGHIAVPMALGCVHQVVLGTLHSAVVCGDTSLAMELLSQGADPNAPDASGFSPVHLAAAFWHHSLLNLLCQRGGSPSGRVSPVNVSASSCRCSGGGMGLAGATPLHLACRRVSTATASGSAVTHDLTSTLSVLLRGGARPNAADAANATPLEVLLGAADGAAGKLPPAAMEELGRAVEVLLAGGARMVGKEEALAAKLVGKVALERAGKAWKAAAAVDGMGAVPQALGPESWAAAGAAEAAAGGGGDAADGCAACGASFTVFRREHHCRVCGCCVCGACSSKTAVLAGGSDPARACDGCFNYLRGAAAAGASCRGKMASPVARDATTDKHGLDYGVSEEKEKQKLFGGAARRGGREDAKGPGPGTAGGVNDMEQLTSQLREGLTERGEKLTNMADKSDQLLESASKFADMAKALNQKQSSWW